MHLSKNKKTSFILNTLGIDMLSISEKLDNSVQTYVHCSLRDRILTLHSHSLDEYSERELELLSKIEASVSKENKKNRILELTWDDFLNNHELLNIEIILNFTNIKIDKKNELTPPNLALLIKKPEEKKLLWEKMQALLNDD
ncbi:MAG: hypothetical protein ACPGIK_00570 [Gammaproteobacteria bacterium]|jgi:hypothetical protein|tara:strand:- start:43 stop:468 length:426 start_codon:yes stop_codon:yes gene_type:complete